jgi:hypothetical protein
VGRRSSANVTGADVDTDPRAHRRTDGDAVFAAEFVAANRTARVAADPLARDALLE